MSFVVHKNTRAVISTLGLPIPVQKHFMTGSIKIDLSNSTNPYTGRYANYPDLTNDTLNQLYLDLIVKIEQQYTPSYRPSRLKSDHLMFTVGSSEGIDLLLRGFCEPHHDSISVMDPTFSAYAHWGAIQGIKVNKIPLTGADLSQLDIAALVKDDPKIIFLCNPNNPTGTILHPDIIPKLCESTQALVVVDEAYNEIADMASALPHFEKYSNLVILRTLSKGWGMAGLRCGWVIADPTIINTLRYIQIPFGLTTPSQEAIIDILKSPQDIFKSWQLIREQRSLMTQRLRGLSCVARVYDSYTNYIFVKLHNFQACMDQLRNAQIHVANFSKIEPDCIKVSISSPEDNQAFTECLAAVK